MKVLFASLLMLETLACMKTELALECTANAMRQAIKQAVQIKPLPNPLSSVLCLTKAQGKHIADRKVLGTSCTSTDLCAYVHDMPQAADRAMEVANIMLEAGCSCCTDDRRLLACRCFNLFLSGCWHAGNIMEACRVKWAADRLDYKAFPYLYSGGMTPNDHRQALVPMVSGFHSFKVVFEVLMASKTGR